MAQIEEDSSDDENELPTVGRARRVSFRSNSPRPKSTDRRRSPPPDQLAHLENTDSDESEEEEVEDEEDDSALSLTRFESGSARPPQMIDDSSSSDEDEPPSPPPLTDEELKTLTGGEGDAQLAQSYNRIRGCPCHGQVDAPKVEKVWEVPQQAGHQDGRIVVVQIAA